jgi:hypothetical protein
MHREHREEVPQICTAKMQREKIDQSEAAGIMKIPRENSLRENQMRYEKMKYSL